MCRLGQSIYDHPNGIVSALRSGQAGNEIHGNLLHFNLGISGCWSGPDGFWYSTLTLAQVKHLPT
ncbi:hypothetical protein Hanom_Chr16g01473581 [Helianthus anomalus]